MPLGLIDFGQFVPGYKSINKVYWSKKAKKLIERIYKVIDQGLGVVWNNDGSCSYEANFAI